MGTVAWSVKAETSQTRKWSVKCEIEKLEKSIGLDLQKKKEKKTRKET